MALPATDNFTGSNNTQLETYSSNWTKVTGNIDIQSNAIAPDQPNDESCHRWNADTFGADQYSKGTLVAVGANPIQMGVAVRISTTGAVTYYGLYADSEQSYLFKMVAGTWDQIGPGGGGWTAGDTIELRVEGTTLTPYRNGSVYSTIGAQTDSSISSGAAGVCAYHDGTATRLDNWEGGNLGGGTTTPRAVAGSLNMAGAQVRKAKKPIAGILDFAGAQIRKVKRGFSGLLSFAGAQIRKSKRPVIGALSFAGAQARRTKRTMAGSLGLAGDIARSIFTVLAGVIGFTGTLSTSAAGVVQQAVGGALSFTGSITRKTGVRIAGVLTTAGLLVKKASTTLNGGLSFVGAAVGSATSVISQAVGGTLSFARAQARRTKRTMAGSLGLAGAIQRKVAMVIAGVLGLAGTLPGFGVTPLVHLTLRARSFLLSLKARSTDLSLKPRSYRLTIKDRSD